MKTTSRKLDLNESIEIFEILPLTVYSVLNFTKRPGNPTLLYPFALWKVPIQLKWKLLHLTFDLNIVGIR